MVANLMRLVSEGSLISHHASTANNYNQSQWSCTRLLAMVSRADSDPDSRILHAGSPPKKLLKMDRSVRRKEKHGCRNDSFPCVCTPPFMFTVISCKIYSIYFDYKRLKFMLLRNEICKKESSLLIFLWITNGDSYLKKHQTSQAWNVRILLN